MNQQRQFLQTSHTFQRMADDFFTMQYRYQAAIQMVTTKLEILDEEFQSRHKRNPIHSMQSRLKTVQSMVDKLRKRHLELSVASAVEHLTDIAGVRVVCSYIQDIYTVANLLTAQKDRSRPKQSLSRVLVELTHVCCRHPMVMLISSGVQAVVQNSLLI